MIDQDAGLPNKRPTAPAQQGGSSERGRRRAARRTDLRQRGGHGVQGGEPAEGAGPVGAAQHHRVPGVWGVQLHLSEGGDKKTFNLSVIAGRLPGLLFCAALDE